MSRDDRSDRRDLTDRRDRRDRRGRARSRRWGQLPDEAALHQILLPAADAAPLKQVGRRVVLALLVMAATIAVVYLGRDGYHDNAHDHLDLLGSAYYATVTLSTTGYGDITPFSDGARLVNILLITPLRVVFLIILVGTTLEVLTTRTRRLWRIKHWRAELDGHVVVVGYGTKGRHAVATLLLKGVSKDRIVVVDPLPKSVETANEDGLVGILGDATRTEVLRRAEIGRAAQVIIGTQRDDTAVLVTLTARQLNKHAVVVVAVREDENAPLLRQSGASVVVTSSGSAGRLLGMSSLSPNSGAVLDDLLTVGNGLDVIDRPVTAAEAGRSPRDCADLVVSVVRGNRRLAYTDPEAAVLKATDRLIAIRRAEPQET
ncbi:TrkA family potassium uptake protein [Streptacidiphilus sp. N1-12]|uniref:TrkA family potassium uptake protein n=2 Tax=Streptacidiphilus alkalitolerans TaxID=3342712 RepID=A0ABV6WDX2_9ACTN